MWSHHAMPWGHSGILQSPPARTSPNTITCQRLEVGSLGPQSVLFRSGRAFKRCDMVGSLQVTVSLPLNVIVGPQPFSFTIFFLAIR